MIVKLENAKIDVDHAFLIKHFDYVERWYESELTQNREQLNLNGFFVDDFNNLVQLIQARWLLIQSLVLFFEKAAQDSRRYSTYLIIHYLFTFL